LKALPEINDLSRRGSIAFHDQSVLLGTAILAYPFSLWHAVDADHIAAIDNITRKLMVPGLKRIKYERLCLPDKGTADDYPNLAGTFARPVRWDLIEQQYDEMVKAAAVIEIGCRNTLVRPPKRRPENGTGAAPATLRTMPAPRRSAPIRRHPGSRRRPGRWQ
jgi:hypothetical protein